MRDREEVLAQVAQLKAIRSQVNALIGELSRELAEEPIGNGAADASAEVIAAAPRPVELDPDLFSNATRRKYLDAGVRIVAAAYRFNYLDGPRDEETEIAERQLLSFVTPERVRAIVGAHSTSTFHALWPKGEGEGSGGRDGYVEDLLRYIFGRSDVFHPFWREIEGAIASEVSNGLEKGDSFSHIAHRITARNINGWLDEPSWYLQLYLESLLGRDEDVLTELVRSCLKLGYDLTLDHYVPEYEATLDSLGLQFREGISMREFAWILTALAEGLALRYQSEAQRPQEAHNVFGTAILALVTACLEPVDPAADPLPQLRGLSLEMLADTFISAVRAGGATPPIQND